MRDYGKVYSTFWSSETTGSLSDDGKLLALYLMTCSHSTIAGVFRLPDGYVSEDLGWANERVRQGFHELFDKGFANRCETTKWVFVRKHLEWNKPENPNQRKSAAKIAVGIPRDCCWGPEFSMTYDAFLGLEGRDPWNPLATVTKPLLNQEQEQEQEQEQDFEEANASSSSAEPTEAGQKRGRTPNTPFEEIVVLYHEVLPELPKVRVMDDDRKKLMAGLWKFVLTSKKSDGAPRATNEAEALLWIRGYFERTRDNDFVMNRTPRSEEHKNWRANLDYLCTSRGMKQVIEKTEAAA